MLSDGDVTDLYVKGCTDSLELRQIPGSDVLYGARNHELAFKPFQCPEKSKKK